MKKLNPFEIKLEERVLRDFEEAFLYYEFISPALSTNFSRMFYLAIDNLSANPNHYFNLTKKLRRITLGKFPYIIVYKIYQDVIIVTGLFHQASKPSKWRNPK